MLFGLFLAFKFLPKELVNLVLSAYFVLLGTMALVATVDPLLARFVPRRLSEGGHTFNLPAVPYLMPEGAEVSFTPLETLLTLPAAGLCYWYWQKKHWVANNALGLAFSVQGIEQLSLGAVQNGVILLCGLFFYDIFWVFCTPVMVSVAKSFDAPIKLLFPRVPAPTAGGSAFSMLGLGDIVIPGIFVAIILRYDIMHKGGRTKFFRSAFIGYVVGLAATIAVMNTFQAAQPALLYIVPAVLIATFGHATAVNEVKELFHWQEKAEEEQGPTPATPPRSGPTAVQAEAEGKRQTRSAVKAATEGKKTS